MASDSGTLYVGVTNSLERRVYEHKTGRNSGFTQRYSCHKLVYYELHETPQDAIDREKQIKRWSREKKQGLIRELNPPWLDLSDGWYE